VKLAKMVTTDDYTEAKNEDTFVNTRVALNLLERISRCIECNEPVLLCGETGVGKTTTLQHLAKLLGIDTFFFSSLNFDISVVFFKIIFCIHR
jgi:midasin (ATPase involved in ribosome maturation)